MCRFYNEIPVPETGRQPKGSVMKSIHTLIRRTALGLSAIVALTVTGYAVSQTSQSVQLLENGSVKSSCSYSTMTVTPNGGIVVTCAGSTSSGPTFSLAAPTSLPVNTTTNSNEVRIVRSGTNASDVQVNYAVSGNGCVGDSSSVTFTAGTGGSMELHVVTNATAGQACSVQITPPTGMAGTPVSRTISVVDPDANVVFAFASGNPTSAAMGGSAVNITVTRTGGTNGDWSVPVVNTGNGTLGAVGTLSGLPLSFPTNGSGSATFQYTPPPATGTAGTVIFGFGTPNRNPTGTQTATATATYTLNLSSPPAGCPSPEVTTLGDLHTNGYVNTLYGTSPVTQTYPLPHSNTGFANIKLYQSAFTPQNGNLRTEIWISKCKGMPANPPQGGCYIASTSLLGPVGLIWQTILTGKLSTPTAVNNAGRCYAPTADGPWYVNVRVTFDNCPAGYPTFGNSCGWQPIWKDQSS